VDLFARRAAGSPSAMRELEQIVEHALFREYPKIAERNEDLRDKAVAMLEEFPERLGQVVAGWLSTICFQQRCWSCATCNYNYNYYNVLYNILYDYIINRSTSCKTFI
jgi:hypothetical protein